MPKAVVYSLVRAHSARTAPLFALLAFVLLAVLPFALTQKNELDENAIKQNRVYITSDRIAHARWGDGVVRWQRRCVRGRRADGAEVVAVYVNADAPASVRLASALIDVLQRSVEVSCDVQFYFVKGTEAAWPVPHAYTRAALVLNVTTLQQPHVCLDSFAHNAMQPNQDLVNAALLNAMSNGLNVEMVCTHAAAAAAAAATRPATSMGMPYRDHDQAKLRNGVHRARYLYHALVAAVQTEQRPQPWHNIPRNNAISTLAFASLPAKVPPSLTRTAAAAAATAAASPRDADVAQRLLLCVLQTIYSLSGLEERFHHSTFVWLPVSAQRYVHGSMLQLVVCLLLMSMGGVLYANYQPDGAAASLVVVWLWCTPLLAAAATMYTPCNTLVATAVVAACVAVALHRYMTRAALVLWCFANLVVLSLLFIVHLPMAVLGGGAATLQLLCLYPVASRAILVLGTAASWLLYAYFALHLHLTVRDVHGVCALYTSLFLYANAVCVTSRSMHMLRLHKASA